MGCMDAVGAQAKSPMRSSLVRIVRQRLWAFATPRVLALLFTLALFIWTSRTQSASEFEILFGNLHAHTSYSDGSGTPEQAYAQAKDAGLDFIALTEHNHRQAENQAGDRRDGILIAKDPSLYDDLITQAETMNATGQLIALWGQEVSSINKGNHVNVFEARAVIDDDEVPNGNYKALYEEWLPAHTEVRYLQFNHPWDLNNKKLQYGLNNYLGDFERLRQATAPYVRLMEVINGPGTKKLSENPKATVQGESFFKQFLTRGFRIGPTADQDNHYFTWGTLTGARTGVLTNDRSLTGLLEAIDARRLYASTDKNLRVHFWVNDSIMGSEISASSRTLTVAYRILDDDESTAPYKIELVYGNPDIPDSWLEKSLGNSTGNTEKTVTFTTPHNHSFVYLRLTQRPQQESKRDFVYTSPVWITVP